MTEKRMIVNADDFGMSRGITDGIVLAHRYGLVTSASLMVNMPAAEYALTRMAKLPQLGLGIHLNICAGRPVLAPEKVPSLVDASGEFHSAPTMIRKLWTWKASGHEIEAEFRAQIRWMKERGAIPSHADSHHHMHIYPVAVRPFVRALRAGGIACTRAPRFTCFPESGLFNLRRFAGAYKGGAARRICVRAYRGMLQEFAFREFTMADGRLFLPLRERKNLPLLEDGWKKAIETLQPGTFELTCHPGLFEPGFSETDPIRAQREEELRWLTSSDLREIADCNGIRLITYRDMDPGAVPTTRMLRHETEEVSAVP